MTHAMQHGFTKNGKPFYPLGGQCTNSAPINEDVRKIFWDSLRAMRANCAEMPIFWELIEPTEGTFNFSTVDLLIEEARAQGFALILLWFGSWKNGAMKYTPAWVKQNPARFHRALTHDGLALNTLSPNCQETLDADARAFAHLMAHLRQVDEAENTVIAVQVQNEPGILGRSFRDFGEEANRQFALPVESKLIDYIAKLENSPVRDAWVRAGSKRDGSWSEVFGPDGAEFFTVYSMAHYIDEVAKAGKTAYDLPMLVNVWLSGRESLPAVDYPCGGAVPKVIDLWKYCAESIDLLSPDIYVAAPSEYEQICAEYDRVDNPLFVPESDVRHCNLNGLNMFIALGDYGAIGYCNFGTEHLILPDGTTNPKYDDTRLSFCAASCVLPLLLRYRKTGRVHTIFQKERAIQQQFLIGDYRATIRFDFGRTDFMHRYPDTPTERGRGLLIEGEDALYLVGGGFRLLLTHKPGPEGYDMTPRLGFINNYFSVEEGYFGTDGQWVTTRTRTGDESDEGIWLYCDVGAVRVRLCD